MKLPHAGRVGAGKDHALRIDEVDVPVDQGLHLPENLRRLRLVQKHRVSILCYLYKYYIYILLELQYFF